MPPLRRLDTAGDAVRQVIRAYHGSPYDFDKFDASKIGSGEGAQAYGHGLYFAGNESVARTYRDDLSRNSFLVEGAKTPWTESTMDDLGVRPRARVTLRMAIRDGRDPIDRLKQAQSGHGPLSAPWNEYQDAIDLLSGAVGKLGPNKGRMYEVEIAHPESSLLDWDRPVSEQPDQIYNALGWSANPPLVDTLGRSGWTGGRAYYKMADEFGGADKVAQRLRDSGVPGIRYLDHGSRRAGDGTRNYVIFPGAEDAIRILRKYGVMAPIPAAAMTGGDE